MSAPVPPPPAGVRQVYAWGSGEDGQLGLGGTADESALEKVSALDGLEVASLAAGSRNSLAICANGDVYVWGWNQRGTLGHPPERGSKAESTPSQVKALEGVRIVQAAIGGWHCLAVDENGLAYAWGGNEYGQCAVRIEKGWDGKMARRDIPIPTPCAAHLKVCQVAAGGTHSMALTEGGEVWTWGQPWPPGDTKQLWSPRRVEGLPPVAAVATGAFHNLALCRGGAVWSWGWNEYGQLGTGDTQPRSTPVPIEGLRGLEIADISAGGWHSMATTTDGQVWAWGRGEHGRLGFGDDKASKTVPHNVALLADHFVVQVSCGGTHSVALTEQGRVFTFGRADNGRLGHPHAVTSGYPVEIPLPLSSGAAAAAAREPAQQQAAGNGHADGGGTPEPEGPRIVFAACGGRHTLVLAAAQGSDREAWAAIRAAAKGCRGNCRKGGAGAGAAAAAPSGREAESGAEHATEVGAGVKATIEKFEERGRAEKPKGTDGPPKRRHVAPLGTEPGGLEPAPQVEPPCASSGGAPHLRGGHGSEAGQQDVPILSLPPGAAYSAFEPIGELSALGSSDENLDQGEKRAPHAGGAAAAGGGGQGSLSSAPPGARPPEDLGVPGGTAVGPAVVEGAAVESRGEAAKEASDSGSLQGGAAGEKRGPGALGGDADQAAGDHGRLSGKMQWNAGDGVSL